MSDNLKNCIGQLILISKLKNNKVRKEVLKNFNEENLYKSIKEIVENLKRKNIKLNTSKKKKLLKFKRIINGFTKKNNNKRIRKKLVHQSGGFLPTLIPIVLSLIESFK